MFCSRVAQLDLRGGDTSDTVYRVVSLYRCIVMYRDVSESLHSEACEEVRSNIHQVSDVSEHDVSVYTASIQ